MAELCELVEVVTLIAKLLVQLNEKWVRASARFCPSVSAGTVRGGRRQMAVDIHALCLPQTRASGKVEKQLYQGMLDIPNNELIIVFSENYAII